MIRKCCVCKIILGTKPPYWDMSITSGFCEPCFVSALRQIERHHEQKGGKKDNVNQCDCVREIEGLRGTR